MAGWGGMGSAGGDAQRAQSRSSGPPRRSGAAPVDVPDDDAWRYRTTGAPRVLAIVGIVLGFVALIVPGILALRSYLRWQDGRRSQPKFAWFMAVAGLDAVVWVLLYRFTPVGFLALVMGMISVPVIALVFLTM
jgi:hypothetical protein